MLVALGVLVWMSLGYAGWYAQIKRIGPGWTGHDAMMIGPMMVLGPIGLYYATRR